MVMGAPSEVGEDLMDWHELADLRGFTALAEGGEGGLTRHVLALAAQRDAATLQLWESVALLLAHTSPTQREFLADELAPGLGLSPASTRHLLLTAQRVAELPDLTEAMRRGELSERHVHDVLDVLRPELDLSIRHAVLHAVLTRYREQAFQHGQQVWPTPAQLRRALRRALLTHRPTEARDREHAAAERRGVSVWPLPDGQAQLIIEGPAPQVFAMKDRIDAAAAAASAAAAAAAADPLPDDPRSPDARRFDAVHALILGTSEHTPGSAPAHTPGNAPAGAPREAIVIVPLSTAQGADLEPGDLPGYGPLLPQTCRDLLATADTLRRAVLDPATGELIALDDPIHVPPGGLHTTLEKIRTTPVVLRDLDTTSYRPSRRLAAHVRLRDRACVFPGCTQPARYTDLDHRQAWPHGRTTARNLHCLCRHHHRAKQARFNVRLLDNGTTTWTSRATGLTYYRPPPDW